MRIIGLAGHPASGKDTVANYLVSKGFKLLSGGDMIRAAMREEGLSTDRAGIQKYVTEKRALLGDAYIVELMLPMITGDTVICAFREIVGIKFLREKFPGQFVLWNVVAPLELRYARAQSRAREGDSVSFEEFAAQEEYERNNPGYSLDAVMASADATIENVGSEVELSLKVDKLLKQL